MALLDGWNILDTAMDLLGRESVQYFQFDARVTGDDGIDVTSYLPPVTIDNCNLTPVKKSNYEKLGLDLAREYMDWHVCSTVPVDLERDVSGDVIEARGGRWQLVGSTDWSAVPWCNWTGTCRWAMISRSVVTRPG